MKVSIQQVFIVLIFAVMALLLGGCGFAQSKKDAETVLVRHFQTVATNGFDAALTDYGAVFFQKTTEAEWIKVITNLNRKLGAYQSHTISGWRVFKKAGTGTTVSLQCQVIYGKHTATENFTLFKGVVDSDYKIIGHNINSAALLTD